MSNSSHSSKSIACVSNAGTTYSEARDRGDHIRARDLYHQVLIDLRERPQKKKKERERERDSKKKGLKTGRGRKGRKRRRRKR
jgi:hypothetical protein